MLPEQTAYSFRNELKSQRRASSFLNKAVINLSVQTIIMHPIDEHRPSSSSPDDGNKRHQFSPPALLHHNQPPPITMTQQPNKTGLTTSLIPCCTCGATITPNPSNQCAACLATVDIASLVRRGPGGGDLVIYQCRQCRKFDPNGDGKQRFIQVEVESPELMAIVLKQIPALTNKACDHHVRKAGITNLKIIDSSYIWTEPNSMRMRILLKLRAEINAGVSIEQRIKVDFIIQWRQCPDCTKESRQRTWQAIVQLRQKRDNDPSKRGLLILELAIARNSIIRKDILSVQTKRNGFDFYFASVNKAQNFASYLGKVAPMKTNTTRAVVSEDVKNNTANVRTTIVCDMVPLCRDDLLIAQKGAKGVGNLSGRLCLVLKMSSAVHLVDASPARDVHINSMCADLHAEGYWKGGEEKSYRTLLTSKRLVRFIVLDVERCHDGIYGDHKNQLYRGPKSGVVNKYALADVQVARESDFGVNDDTFQCVTHLGNLLQVGDVVLGYDLNSTVLANETEDNTFNSSFVMPDVILVRKVKGVGGGVTRESSRPDDEDVRNRLKAKSSASKKRERRMAKEELKQKKLLEASSRMGLDTDKDIYLDLDDFEDDGGGEAFAEAALAKKDEQIEIDDELADDLDFVELELAMGMHNLATLDETSTVDETTSTVDETSTVDKT